MDQNSLEKGNLLAKEIRELETLSSKLYNIKNYKDSNQIIIDAMNKLPSTDDIVEAIRSKIVTIKAERLKEFEEL